MLDNDVTTNIWRFSCMDMATGKPFSVADFTELAINKSTVWGIRPEHTRQDENGRKINQVRFGTKDGKAFYASFLSPQSITSGWYVALRNSTTTKRQLNKAIEDEFVNDLFTLANNQDNARKYVSEAYMLIMHNNKYVSPLSLIQDNVYCDFITEMTSDQISATGASSLLYYIKQERRIDGYKRLAEFSDVKALDTMIRAAARTPDELSVYKTIMCWTVASMMKKQLINHGFSIYPILVLIGGKGTGKSTALKSFTHVGIDTLCTSGNNLRKATLKNTFNSVFPLFFDELKVLDGRTTEIEILKMAATAGYLNIVNSKAAGKPGEGWEVNIINPVCIATNELAIDDEAMLSRIFEITYPEIYETNMGKTTIFLPELRTKTSGFYKWLFENKLGDIADEFFGDYRGNINNLYADFKVLTGVSSRYAEMIVYFKLGEYVLDKIGLLTGVQLFVANSRSDWTVDRRDGIIVQVRKIIYDTIDKWSQGSMTFEKMYRDNTFSSPIVDLLAAKGIHLVSSHEYGVENVVLSTEVLSWLDKAVVGKIKNLSALGFGRTNIKLYPVIKSVENGDFKKRQAYGVLVSVHDIFTNLDVEEEDEEKIDNGIKPDEQFDVIGEKKEDVSREDVAEYFRSIEEEKNKEEEDLKHDDDSQQ